MAVVFPCIGRSLFFSFGWVIKTSGITCFLRDDDGVAGLESKELVSVRGFDSSSVWWLRVSERTIVLAKPAPLFSVAFFSIFLSEFLSYKEILPLSFLAKGVFLIRTCQN